jgi:hypothetical protein
MIVKCFATDPISNFLFSRLMLMSIQKFSVGGQPVLFVKVYSLMSIKPNTLLNTVFWCREYQILI